MYSTLALFVVCLALAAIPLFVWLWRAPRWKTLFLVFLMALVCPLVALLTLGFNILGPPETDGAFLAGAMAGWVWVWALLFLVIGLVIVSLRKTLLKPKVLAA